MNIIQALEQEQLRSDIPEFAPGDTVRVSDENRRRILDVARREHYIPNQIARSLVTQHTQTLGLIVPNTTKPCANSFTASTAKQ